MTEEKKILRGGVTPEHKDAALDDATLDAVSGGLGPRPTSLGAVTQAWDSVMEILGANDDTEQQP